MKRPTGVTVMANIFLFMAYTVVSGFVMFLFEQAPRVLPPRFLALSATNLLIAVTLSVALFKMKNWSRWACIVVCAVSLIFIPREVVVAHGLADLVRAGLRTLFFVWVICYLSQPTVKAAFRSVPNAQ
jgi:uncharacterized membrane protein (DUF373 family)